MTIDELQQILDSASWKLLGQGNYNQVEVSEEVLTIKGYTGRWVLKRKNPRAISSRLNHPERAVRKWNLLNPEYPAIIAKEGWIAPYLGNQPASDEQIALKIMDIYRRTQNVIGDAAAKGPNFIVYNNEVICIDVDHAYSRTSVASKDIKIHKDKYNDFLSSCEQEGFPHTSKTIKILLYLERNFINEAIPRCWIKPETMPVLDIFCQRNIIITANYVNRILEAVHLIAASDKKFKQLTPEFIYFLQRRLRKAKLNLPVFDLLLKEYLLAAASIEQYVCNGYINEVEILIDYDKSLLTRVDPSGYTLLHLAVKYERIDIMNALINAGMDTKARVLCGLDAGLAILDLACRYNCDRIAIALFQKGHDFLPHQQGKTHIIHILARHGFLSNIRYLLSVYPELLDARDAYHYTPLRYAQIAGHQDLVNFLQTVSHDNKRPINHSAQSPSQVVSSAYAALSRHTMFSVLSFGVSGNDVEQETAPLLP